MTLNLINSGVMLAIVAAPLSFAQTPAPAAPAAPAVQAAPAAPAAPTAAASPVEDWIKKSKNPVSWMTWGADLRLRHEYINNGMSLNPQAAFHEMSYGRFRTRFWTSLMPLPDLAINARVTVEPREWYMGRARSGWDWTEGIVDQLNFRWTNMFGLPATLTVGRQDIMFGEPLNWWLVADGTPSDGSRTFFFDAARLTYKLDDYKTTVDAIYIDQGGRNDRWFTTFNNQDKLVTDQNERGAILYVSNKSLKKTQLDGYLMYKHDYWPASAAGDKANLYTLGTKISGDVGEHWRYSAEGAYQMGRRDDPMLAVRDPQSVSALGFNSRLTYLFKDPLKNQVRFNYEYLSGDDPNTRTYEQFDLLWGRWPRWSELYIYSYVRETRVAQFSNLHRVGPGWTINPTAKSEFLLDYNVLFADENNKVGTPNGALFTPNGSLRGQLLTAVFKYKFNAHLSGHLWSEFLFPGDYYQNDSKPFTFLRAELLLTY